MLAGVTGGTPGWQLVPEAELGLLRPQAPWSARAALPLLIESEGPEQRRWWLWGQPPGEGVSLGLLLEGDLEKKC